MSSVAAEATVAAGTVLVLLTLREMFHELFHPAGSGALGAGLHRGLWWAFRTVARTRRSVLVLAGPAILVTTVVVWTVLLGVGWALVFWPFLPEGFRFGSPLTPAEQVRLGRPARRPVARERARGATPLPADGRCAPRGGGA